MKTATATSRKNVSSGSRKGTPSRNNGTKKEDINSLLGKLFEDELKDIYWAEKSLTKAIPKMIKKATSQELIDALEKHLDETKEHVSRVERIFSMMGKDAKAKKCEAMAGLIKEAEEIMSDSKSGVMRDAGIISAAQKVEHYEIASYGTLRTFAKTLGMDEIASIIVSTLREEKNADTTLTEVAERAINIEAAETEK